MNNLNARGLDSATVDFRVLESQSRRAGIDAVLSRARQPLVDAVTFFFEKPVSPLTLMAFEIALLGIVRELGRHLLELRSQCSLLDAMASRFENTPTVLSKLPPPPP